MMDSFERVFETIRRVFAPTAAPASTVADAATSTRASADQGDKTPTTTTTTPQTHMHTQAPLHPPAHVEEVLLQLGTAVSCPAMAYVSVRAVRFFVSVLSSFALPPSFGCVTSS